MQSTTEETVSDVRLTACRTADPTASFLQTLEGSLRTKASVSIQL